VVFRRGRWHRPRGLERYALRRAGSGLVARGCGRVLRSLPVCHRVTVGAYSRVLDWPTALEVKHADRRGMLPSL
jgi:hypothetical protein